MKNEELDTKTQRLKDSKINTFVFNFSNFSNFFNFFNFFNSPKKTLTLNT